jgi:hypothetical protein
MYKVIVLSCIFSVAACRPQLKITNKPDTTKQNTSNSVSGCNIPYDVDSDSLFNFALHTNTQRARVLGFKPKSYSDSTIGATFYRKTPQSTQDSCLRICQQYLFAHLGAYLYCNNLYLTINSFEIDQNNCNIRYLTFNFLVPHVVTFKTNIWTGKNLANTEFKFTIDYRDKKAPKITIPENVPDCKDLLDCGFTINRDSAITLLKKNHYLQDGLKENVDYSLTTNGREWEFKHADKKTGILFIKINMQNGLISKQMAYFEDDIK